MLRPVCLALGAVGPVSVVARPSPRLEALVARTGGAAVAVDWRDDDALRRGVLGAVERLGPASRVVSWCHSDAPRAPLVVARAVADVRRPPRFFQIYGGRDDAAGAVKRGWHEALSSMPGIAYRRVSLWAEGGRWLTDSQIARGVLAAVEDDALDHRVLPGP
jgi:hypothetical protein